MLLELLSAPLGYFLDPSRRLFWLFIVSGLVIASATVALQQGRFDFRSQLNALFDRRYWLNRSSAIDVSLLLLNSSLRVLFLVPLLGSHLAATVLVGSSFQSTFGDAPDLGLSFAVIGALYTFSFFLLEDFSRFGLHFAMHKVPWLWYFHRVHHSATNLTPITVHRVHPVEMTLYQLRGLIVFGLVSGAFVYFFGNQVNGWMILGVDALGFMFNFMGSNLRHSPIPVSFGSFERWLMSPAQHQIHHSSAIEHMDQNFGTCLALWDKLTKSWVRGSVKQKLDFGLQTNKVISKVSQQDLFQNG